MHAQGYMQEPDIHLNKQHTLKPNNSVVRNVHFNKDGKYCITSESDRTVKLWNPFKNMCLKTYSGHGHEVLDAISLSDNSQIVSGSIDKSVIIWDVMSGQALRRFRYHHAQINCVMYNYDECSIMVSGSSDNTACIWDMLSRSNKPVQVLNQSKDAVLSIDIKGSKILLGSVDGCFRTYDIRKGELVKDDIGFPICCSKFVLDDNSILGCLSNNSIVLLDVVNGNILNKFDGLKSEKFKIQCDIAFNDSFVASGSEDGCVYFWDIVSGKVVKKIKAHNGVVYALALHPDHSNNSCMLTASNDGVNLWSKN